LTVAPEFEATSDTGRAAELSKLVPENPFCTPAFIESWRRLGWEPCLFFVRDGTRAVAGCAGLMKHAPGNATLEVPSLPELPDPESFWRHLLAWCATRGVQNLNVQGYGSPPIRVPASTNGAVDHRLEYRLRLGPGMEASWWPAHRDYVEVARRSGLQTVSRRDRSAVRAHVRLAEETWEVHHGVITPGPHTVTARVAQALIETGAAELHVARGSGEAVASALVLLSPAGACIHSLGIDAAHAKTGAAHLLCAQLATDLCNRGIRQLTLGDAEESHALVETLMAGFATDRVLQPSARFTFGAGWKRKPGTLLRLAAERPGALVPAVLGRVERYVAYQTRPRDMPQPQPSETLRLEALDLRQLDVLSEKYPDAIRHRDRARKLGYCTAWGLYVDGELAHISWLVNAADDERNPIRNVKLRPGEVEIGPCSTFPAYRGRSLYAFVIQTLCKVAADRGVERVFMITSSRNIPSQRGIEKAGLERCGSIWRIVSSSLGGRSLTLRGHRWRIGRGAPARVTAAEAR
jgi:hypothetical protein